MPDASNCDGNFRIVLSTESGEMQVDVTARTRTEDTVSPYLLTKRIAPVLEQTYTHKILLLKLFHRED